ncbi:39S ribosomal protein L32, mitochondrial-like [Mizuhopecten yessoensis]|uniref:39S ribosomal protein L32, mitochondrial n=1 Tax=Mizuhopecten yessoensis TaxID=6573 RepID=A0A210PRJ9_MIZYE|nr:39S ribosomal protein L32, mitochondrial-like [Mizuhopecten yessoensis]OWF39066.1 39S ribosomal protein L32, mitochondrial [Mizuhopecten yessoensis]
MAANMSVFQRLQKAWKQLDSLFLRWTVSQYQFLPALVGGPVVPEETDIIPSDNSSFLRELFGGNGIMWISHQTQRSRRSKEKRQTRRFGYSFVEKRVKIHKDIVSCLRCGSFHKLNTICGNCYDKVRQETDEMRKKMGDHLEYESPHKEVAVIYEGEEDQQQKLHDKFIVQMDKPRPKWFSDFIDADKKKKKWSDS